MRALQRGLRLFSCLGFSCLVSLALEQQKSDVQPTSTDAVKTTISATVRDHDHHVVTGLKAEDFTVFEDGRSQMIQSVSFGDVPACIGVLVDRSGSMRGHIREATQGAMDLVRASNPGNLVFIVNFNDDPWLDQDFTHDYTLLERALDRGQARGGTALYDTISLSAEHLARARECNRRVLVILSDGEDNESRKTLEQTVAAIRSSGNPLVYAIGLPNEDFHRSQLNRRALEALTNPTGGAVFFANNFKEVGKAAQRVAEEMRNQYSVTFAPGNTQSAGFPNIKLVARAEGRKTLETRVNVATKIDLPAASPGTSPAAASALPAPRTSCIAGTVADAQENPVRGITVEAHLANSTTRPYPFAVSEDDGKFRISNLQAGSYVLYTANETEGYPFTWHAIYRENEGRAMIFAAASEDCKNISVKVGPKAARLKVSAVDASTHEPISNFRVELRNAHSGLMSVIEANTAHDVLLPARTDLTVVVWARGYAKSQPINLHAKEPGASEQISVALNPITSSSR
jgi:Ca-activated chloride channel homolog